VPALATPARLRQRLAATIRGVDPGARDAVLIGSSVYAPDLARDYDLVLTTTAPAANRHELWSALVEALEQDTGGPVDLIVRVPGEAIGQLALAVMAGRVVLGQGETVTEARAVYEEAGGVAHSFEEADSCLVVAHRNWLFAKGEPVAQNKRRLHMVAFDELFHAARIAALTYLGREDDRWGGLDRVLPAPYGAEFKQMIAVLHMRYGYEGNIPAGREDQEFEAWRRRVATFVDAFRGLAAT
jgi:hypothetical protein